LHAPRTGLEQGEVSPFTVVDREEGDAANLKLQVVDTGRLAQLTEAKEEGRGGGGGGRSGSGLALQERKGGLVAFPFDGAAVHTDKDSTGAPIPPSTFIGKEEAIRQLGAVEEDVIYTHTHTERVPSALET
jgi:hypothetical protein